MLDKKRSIRTFSASTTNTNLTTLELSSNHQQHRDEEALTLADALKTSTAVTTVNPNFSDEGSTKASLWVAESGTAMNGSNHATL